MGQYDELADLVRKYLALTDEIVLLDRKRPVWTAAGRMIQSQEDWDEAKGDYEAFEHAKSEYHMQSGQLEAQRREVGKGIAYKLPQFGFLIVEDGGKKYSIALLPYGSGIPELSIDEYNP